MTNHWDADLDLARRLADAADAISMSYYRSHDLVIETKPDLTPVTEADKAVEQGLREILAAERPDDGILGEEFGVSGSTERTWILDPIDGTKNYVRGVPIWATLIALEVDGRLDVGVVSAPALGMRWWAGRGLGAFRDGDRISVSEVGDLADAQLSFAWDTSGAFAGLGDRLLGLAHRCWRARGIGDFWQHLLVAEGAFDIAVDPVVSLWDVAALVPILEEAGARWSTVDGRTDPDGGSFVCTNGRLHDAALAALGGTA
ncbi:MAG: inositol monophosphatase family protein [Actinomycetota bacterium]